jgi:hypothetical protein
MNAEEKIAIDFAPIILIIVLVWAAFTADTTMSNIGKLWSVGRRLPGNVIGRRCVVIGGQGGGRFGEMNLSGRVACRSDRPCDQPRAADHVVTTARADAGPAL